MCQKMLILMRYMILLINEIIISHIIMKPIDVKSNSHAECNVNSNAKDAKFKIGDHI